MTTRTGKGSGQRREQILSVAARLFAENGIPNVSTRRIAEAVGISQPSLYAHFQTSGDIAIEVCRRGFDRLHARLAAAAARPGDAASRLQRMNAEYVAFALEHPAEYKVALMLDLPPYASGPDSPVLAAGLKAFSVIQGLFDETYANPRESALRAQSAWAALHGLVALMLARPAFPWAGRTALIKRHIEAIGREAHSPQATPKKSGRAQTPGRYSKSARRPQTE